jgi:ABC-2 type transport system permease protein
VNAKNVLRAQSVETYLRSIARRVALPADFENRPGLRFDVRSLYNPTFETSVYMVPGVLCILVCIVTILLTSMSVAREREIGTLETLLAAPVRPRDVVLGKTVPYVVLGMAQLPLILGAAMFLFGIPMRGPLLMLLIAGFFFITTTVSIGLLISTQAKNQQQAMLGGFLYLFPSVLMSGLMFPIENMPLAMQWLAQLNPLTHFVGLLRNILLKGGDPGYFVTRTGALALLASVTVTLALRRFRTTLS